MSGGRPDEAAFAGPEHLDPAYVAGYDRKAGFDPAGDIEVLREHGLGPASTLIDLGAGTGTFAVAAAAVCGRVVAVDVSPAMVRATRCKAAVAGARNVECVQAGFLTYEHHGDAPGFVYTRNALHHLPDMWKAVALARIGALIAPGGVLRLRDLVYSFEPTEAEAGIERWLETGADRPESGWTRQELDVPVRDEHSTFAWLLETMLDRAGFDIVESGHRGGVHADYLCLRRGAAWLPG